MEIVPIYWQLHVEWQLQTPLQLLFIVSFMNSLIKDEILRVQLVSIINHTLTVRVCTSPAITHSAIKIASCNLLP